MWRDVKYAYTYKRSGENALWQALFLFNLSHIPRRQLRNILATGHEFWLKILNTKGSLTLLEKGIIKTKKLETDPGMIYMRCGVKF